MAEEEDEVEKRRRKKNPPKIQVANSSMAPQRLPALVLLLLLLCATSNGATSGASGARSRRCCKYASWDPSSSSSSSSVGAPCSAGPDACVVRMSDGELVSPGLQECNVAQDTKKDSGGAEEAKADCLADQFDDDGGGGGGDGWMEEFSGLPFSVRSYAFSDGSSPRPLPAVEVAVEYEQSWSSARFRIVDRSACPLSHGSSPSPSSSSSSSPLPSSCSPRCVGVIKSHSARSEGAELLYDCEVGFFTSSDDRSVVVTSGHLYELSVCLSGVVTSDARQASARCGQFYFVMPSVREEGGQVRLLRALPLLDKRALEQDRTVVLHFPADVLGGGRQESEVGIVLYGMEEGEEEWRVMANKTFSIGGKYSTLVFREDDMEMEAGEYRVVVEEDAVEVEVAKFRVEEERDGGGVAGAVAVLLLLLLVGAAAFYLYRRYQQIRSSSVVHPNRLLESGRIGGKSVFVVTNVDNRHHIDVVMALNKYLKVGAVASGLFFFFFLDICSDMTTHF